MRKEELRRVLEHTYRAGGAVMARKILFRGKGCGGGEWFYGDLIHRRFLGKDVVIIRSEDNGFDNYVDYKVIPETVGQYTGLTDKNGTKIFEGDIAKVYDRFTGREHSSWPVVTIVDQYAVKVQSGSYWCPQDTVIFEVIGNIHDNPELLEEV